MGRLGVGITLFVSLVASGAPKAPGVEVRLVTTPPGATAVVDGRALKEATPTVTKLSPGRHRVTLAHEGYARLDTSITVKASKAAQRFEFQLKPLPAALTVSSTPDGALAQLDGVAMGQTPFTTTADAGVHEVSVELAGYRPDRQQVELVLGGRSTVELTLQPLPVRVDFEVAPIGSELVIDGADAGVAPAALELPVGSHSGLAPHPGYRPQPLAFEVRAGSPAHVAVALEPEANDGWSTLLPPPPPPPREELALVADETIDLEVKLSIIRAAAQRSEGVTSLVQATRPRKHRGILCSAVREWATTVPVVVRALNAFGDEVTGALWVDEKPWGPLPFRGELPVCSGVVAAADVGTRAPVEQTVELELESGRAIDLHVGGRRPMAVFSLLFDYDRLSWSAVNVAGEPPHYGGGVRYDFWDHIFHFNAALKTSPTLNELVKLTFGGAVPSGVLLGGFPTLDLFFGWGSAVGGLALDRVRVHWALDVGAWGLLFPTVRASLAVNLFDLVFVSVGGDLHFNPALFGYAKGLAGQNVFASGLLFPGLTVALGVGF
jgi:hypothetical protein